MMDLISRFRVLDSKFQGMQRIPPIENFPRPIPPIKSHQVNPPNIYLNIRETWIFFEKIFRPLVNLNAKK